MNSDCFYLTILLHTVLHSAQDSLLPFYVLKYHLSIQRESRPPPRRNIYLQAPFQRHSKVTSHQSGIHTRKILLRSLPPQQAQPSTWQYRPSHLRRLRRSPRWPNPVYRCVAGRGRVRFTGTTKRWQRKCEKDQRRNAHHGILRRNRGTCFRGKT